MNFIGQFIDAISNKNKIRVTFFSKEDQKNVTRLCAPMDYGHSKKAHDKSSRFHLWDYDSDSGSHTLSILPTQVISMEFLEERFCPSEFVTWEPAWILPRDWGVHS